MNVYEFIKKHVAGSGELMVKVADGQKFELHIHNTKFDEKEKMIVLDAGAETYWINPDQIVYMWIHRVKE